MNTRLLLIAVIACIGGSMPSPAMAQILSAVDVQQIVNQASSRAAIVSPDSTIAVVDREGNVLVVWATGAAPSAQRIGDAISRGGTACFLNSNQNALTSRSANYLVQPNFPPGLRNRNNGPLTGVNFSNLPYSDVNRFRQQPFPVYAVNPAVAPPIGTLGGAIRFTSLSGFCGGVPLYKNGVLVGGVGVAGDGDDTISPSAAVEPDTDEDVALAGQKGFEPPARIRSDRIFLDGISVPYVRTSTRLPAVIAPVGAAVAGFPLLGSPLPAGYPNVNIYPPGTVAGVAGEFRAPVVTDVANASALRLTAADVNNIIEAAVRAALSTRTAVRRPLGGPTSMWIAVVGRGNPNVLPLVPPPILGIFKMPDAVTRSWDFAVAKGRTCVGFSSNTKALSSRSVGFLSQFYYPPGINDTNSGPFFGLQPFYSDTSIVPADLLNPSASAPNRFFANGITIFPGGQPLYKGTELVGAIGISGDAIDQDDLVACAGTAALRADGLGRFTAPPAIRADAFAYRGARLPFAKFPRQPTR
ncbi:MAG: heme-binding protein [Candidatus Methylacidiphilales bacterium]|nr:heme-binding protein [Candidatus Methylacidiphilales bacterium]